MNGYAEIFWGAFKLRAQLARPRVDDLEFFAYRRKWNVNIARGFGFDVKASGPLPKAPSLVVSNHSGFGDIMALIMTSPAEAMLNFVSKKEIGELPIFGWHMKPYGDVLFDRSNPDARKAVVKESLDRMRKGFSVLVFPEGTRSRDGLPKKEIRPALVEAAIAAGFPVHPVGVAGTLGMVEKPYLKKRGQKIRLTYGEPRTNFKDATEVWTEVRRLWEIAAHEAR